MNLEINSMKDLHERIFVGIKFCMQHGDKKQNKLIRKF